MAYTTFNAKNHALYSSFALTHVDVDYVATIAQSLPSITQGVAGKLTYKGTAANALSAITQGGAGKLIYKGTAIQEFPAIIQSAAATFSAPPSIENLVSFWKLGEASGTRADSVGSNDLADINTVGQTTGKVGNGALFASANSETLRLAAASATSLDLSTSDFFISAWIWMATLSAQMSIVSKKQDNNNFYDFYVKSTGIVEFTADDSGGANELLVTGTTALSVETWYNIILVVDRDSTAATRIYIDNVDDTAGTPTVDSGATNFSSPGDFNISGTDSGTAFFDGIIDAAAFGKFVPTTADRATLYNSGNGWEPS